jgi:methionyl-tRNA synthetase
MVAKNLDGIVPVPTEFTADDKALLEAADALMDRVRGHYDATAMHLALEAIWSVLAAANTYFSAQEPWMLRKSDEERFRTVLYTTLETVRIATLLSQPVMPESTGKLLDLLGQPEDQRTFTAIGTRLVPGTALPAPVGVFPRYQVE